MAPLLKDKFVSTEPTYKHQHMEVLFRITACDKINRGCWHASLLNTGVLFEELRWVIIQLMYLKYVERVFSLAFRINYDPGILYENILHLSLIILVYYSLFGEVLMESLYWHGIFSDIIRLQR